MSRNYAQGLAAGSNTGVLESRRTKLVTRTASGLAGISGIFADTGRNGDEVCLSVVPENTACCYQCLLEVPSGFNVLWSHWGASQGMRQPGMIACWPVWNSVNAVISKQVITYNAVPKRCPTKDMVMVDVDLSVNMKIGPDPQRVEEFYYKCGATRLDAYMYFEVEECIRSLVNGVTYDKVNDLRSDFASEMLRTLQSKVTSFGVEITNVKITNVELPRELQQRLEKTTAFATRLAESEKNQKFALQQQKNDHMQQMAAIEQTVSIERQRIAAEAARYEINQDEAMSVAQSARKVQLEEARGRMDVAVTKAKGKVEVAQFEGRAEAETVVKTTTIAAEQDLRAAKLESATSITAAESHKTASNFLAQARKAEAQADGEAAAQLEEKVRFEQKLRLAEIDASLAANGRKFLSGDAGAGILKSFVMVRDELA